MARGSDWRRFKHCRDSCRSRLGNDNGDRRSGSFDLVRPGRFGSSPVMKSARKTGPCSRRSSPPASSTTSTRPPTSPKHSRRSSTAIPVAASKTSCRGDFAKRQASFNRVAAKRLPGETNDAVLNDNVVRQQMGPSLPSEFGDELLPNSPIVHARGRFYLKSSQGPGVSCLVSQCQRVCRCELQVRA